VAWGEWTEAEREQFGELVQALARREWLWAWGPGPREQVDAGARRQDFDAAQKRARAERRQALAAARLYVGIGDERVGIKPPKDHPLFAELNEQTALPEQVARRTGKPTGRPRKDAERKEIRRLHAEKPGRSKAMLARDVDVSRDLVTDALRPPD